MSGRQRAIPHDLPAPESMSREDLVAEVDGGRIAYADLVEDLRAAKHRNRTMHASLYRVRVLLENEGCSCECEHHREEHVDDCELCFACRVSAVVSNGGDNRG